MRMDQPGPLLLTHPAGSTTHYSRSTSRLNPAATVQLGEKCRGGCRRRREGGYEGYSARLRTFAGYGAPGSPGNHATRRRERGDGRKTGAGLRRLHLAKRGVVPEGGIALEDRAATRRRSKDGSRPSATTPREARGGAGGGNRTPMTLRSPDFESGASASFTTPAVKTRSS